jgi:hypoxanthine-DNA glycosylase
MASAFDFHGASMQHCFPPVTRPDTRLLVLGSLPGAVSLARQRYYAHPRNLFWRLMGAAIGRDLVPLDYEARLEALLDAHVGLWDTVAAATREGSLDADIRLHEASDLAALVRTLPNLKAIGFNGATSARIGRKQLGDAPGLALIDLPSSSPAYASLPFEKKKEAWLALRAYL